MQTKRMETDMLCGVVTKLKHIQKSENYPLNKLLALIRRNKVYAS